jgi:hypothetical protein
LNQHVSVPAAARGSNHVQEPVSDEGRAVQAS